MTNNQENASSYREWFVAMVKRELLALIDEKFDEWDREAVRLGQEVNVVVVARISRDLISRVCAQKEAKAVVRLLPASFDSVMRDEVHRTVVDHVLQRIVV